jgi:hypothetical protein
VLSKKKRTKEKQILFCECLTLCKHFFSPRRRFVFVWCDREIFFAGNQIFAGLISSRIIAATTATPLSINNCFVRVNPIRIVELIILFVETKR